MQPGAPPLKSRLASALGASAVLGLFAVLFLRGFAVPVAGPHPALRLTDFALQPPPPPLPPDPPRARDPKPRNEAAQPNLVSRATEIVAPPPLIPLPTIIAAERADLGSEASSGAAPVAGPGTGAGGTGDGSGGGGDGGGTELRWLEGELSDADFPESALDAGAEETVGIRFVVGVNGRVTQCTVTQSSGNVALDQTTCRLIQKRFRYAPSRNARGEPVPDIVTGEQVWENRERPGANGRR